MGKQETKIKLIKQQKKNEDEIKIQRRIGGDNEEQKIGSLFFNNNQG